MSLIMTLYAHCHLAQGNERQHRKVYVVGGGGGAMRVEREMEVLSTDQLVKNICWRSTIMNYN